MFREFKQSGDADSVVLATENDTADCIKFGVDSNGKYGYIAPGADSVTPFRGFGDLEFAYNQGIADSRLEHIAFYTISGDINKGTYINTSGKESFTFSKNYAQVVMFMYHRDSDNNGDNFMKVYSTDKGFTTNAAPAASYWTDTVGEWNYFKPEAILGLGTNRGYAATNTNKYSSTPNDYNKDVYRKFGDNYLLSCVAYKNNVMSGETAYLYGVDGTAIHILGIPATGVEPYSGATPTTEEADMYQRGYAAGIAASKLEHIAYYGISGSGSNSTRINANGVESITFDKDYVEVIMVMSQNDGDDNGDNFMKVYSIDKGFTTNAVPAAGYWTDTSGEWNYLKPTTLTGKGTSRGYSATNSNKYSSVPNDYNKDVWKSCGGSYIHSCVAYKYNVRAGETAYLYGSAGTGIHILGIPVTESEPYLG